MISENTRFSFHCYSDPNPVHQLELDQFLAADGLSGLSNLSDEMISRHEKGSCKNIRCFFMVHW